MGARVTVGRPLSVVFVPRGSLAGPPVELEDVSAELVRASDFEVVGTLGDGLTLTRSGAPHSECVVSGPLPAEAKPGELYFVRLRGEYGRKTYRAVESLVVEADAAAQVSTQLQNLIGLVVSGAGG